MNDEVLIDLGDAKQETREAGIGQVDDNQVGPYAKF